MSFSKGGDSNCEDKPPAITGELRAQLLLGEGRLDGGRGGRLSCQLLAGKNEHSEGAYFRKFPHLIHNTRLCCGWSLPIDTTYIPT